MADMAAVRRYTRALFGVAQRDRLVDRVGDDLQAFEAVLRSEPRLRRVLKAPIIPEQQKRDLVRSAFAGKMDDLTLRFVEMVIRKNREEILDDVPAEFQRLSYAMSNVIPVQVTSAVPLEPAEREALSKSLSVRTGKKVLLDERVDPELMGGALLRIGDTIIDGSVRGQLRLLRKRFLSPRAAEV